LLHSWLVDCGACGAHQAGTIQRGAGAKVLVGEGVITRRRLEAGKAWLLARGAPREDGLRGPVQARQHLWQDLGMDCSIRRERGLPVWQLRLLFGIGRGAALPSSPPGAALLQRTGIQLAAQQERLLQQRTLRWSRLESAGACTGTACGWCARSRGAV